MTPSTVHILLQLANRLGINGRQDEVEAGEVRSDSDGLFLVSKLPGNLARIYFDGDPPIDTVAWCAPSSRISSIYKEWSTNPSYQERVLAPIGHDHIYQTLDDLEAHAFSPRFPAARGRESDSEYLLINALANELGGLDAHGSLYLMSERIPCSSCTAVLVSFAVAYPKIELHVLFMFHTHERSHTDFLLEAASIGHRLQLDKCHAEGDTLTVIPVTHGSVNNH